MSRRLLAVVVLPTPRLAGQVDALRVALDDPRRFDLPTHLTLVPPIALAEHDAGAVRSVVRDVATRSAPFQLVLGPTASFAPETSTLHLAVRGQVQELLELRDRLRVDPLDRPDVHPFVPHVTLLQHTSAARIVAAAELLVGPLDAWDVDRLVVMERAGPPGGAVWAPVIEEAFGGVDVVGRGGVELGLRTITTLEPAAAELCGVEPGPAPFGMDPHRLVVVAEGRDDPGPAGCAIGRASPDGAVLERVAVAPSWRQQGVARHVLAHWCLAATRRGARAVVAAADGPTGVLEALGFTRAGSMLLRRLT